MVNKTHSTVPWWAWAGERCWRPWLGIMCLWKKQAKRFFEEKRPISVRQPLYLTQISGASEKRAPCSRGNKEIFPNTAHVPLAWGLNETENTSCLQSPFQLLGSERIEGIGDCIPKVGIIAFRWKKLTVIAKIHFYSNSSELSMYMKKKSIMEICLNSCVVYLTYIYRYIYVHIYLVPFLLLKLCLSLST